jgi:peroxiredoxin
MTLQDKLDAVKAEFVSMVPAELRAVMDKTTADLISSGQAERAAQPGLRAPAFSLLDQDGLLFNSAESLRSGPLVVTFYRGAWCPYCNLDLQAMEEAAVSIRAAGASLIAISQQTANNSRKSLRDNKLSFPILTDKGGEVANSFGIRWTSPECLQSIYKQLGVDLAAFNGESSWTLPMPARYVISQNGVIEYAEISPDYTKRPEPSDLLPVLQKLRAAANNQVS